MTVDFESRQLLSSKLYSNIFTVLFLATLQIALKVFRNLQIFLYDQDCQFTSVWFVPRLKTERILTSGLCCQPYCGNFIFDCFSVLSNTD